MSTVRMENRIVRLRAMEPEDINLLYEVENDPDVWEAGDYGSPYSRHALTQYIISSQNDIFADKQLRLIIERKEDLAPLGIIDITNFSALHLRGEVGIVIRGEYRNKGYASNALELLCDYAFSYLRINQLYARFLADNKPCAKLFKGRGFEYCGLLKAWVQTTYGEKDVIICQRLKSKA